MCLNKSWQECTSGMNYGSPTAAYALFLQFYGDSVFEKAMEMVGSCFRSGWLFRMCSQSLLKLIFAEMRVGSCYARFLQL